MEKILPIGSVLEFNNKQVIVLGYHLGDNGKSLMGYYLTALLPMGFTELNDIIMIAANQKIKVISEGYMNSETELFLERKRKLFEKSLKINKNMLNDVMNYLLTELEKENSYVK